MNFQQGLVQPPVEQKWSKRISVKWVDKFSNCESFYEFSYLAEKTNPMNNYVYIEVYCT